MISVQDGQERILAEITARGPMAFTDLEHAGRVDRSAVKTKYAESTLLWWRYSDGKSVMGALAGEGIIAVAGRRGFDPLYDLAEQDN